MSSPEFLATAAVRIVPDTAAFRAALVAEVAAATKAITIPLPVAFAKGTAAAAAENTALVKALQARGAVLLDVAAAETATAVASQESGAAAAREAVAHRTAARAVAEHAAAQEALIRGAGASALTLFGLRGATLAASAPFLAGTVAIVTFAKAVEEASAEQEALARVVRILGPELGKQSEEWARLQASVGLSSTAALRAEGAFAEVLHNVGLANPQVAQMAQAFAELAPNVAAFNNVDVETILRAIQLGISGNLRALRPYIGALRQATITQIALRNSGKETVAELTDQDLLFARTQAILARLANQSQAASERSGDLAQQSRVLKANVADLSAEIGSALLPALVQVTGDLNALFQGANKIARLPSKIPFLDRITKFANEPHGGFSFRDLALSLNPVTAGFAAFDQTAKLVDKALGDDKSSADALGGSFVNLRSILPVFGGDMEQAAKATLDFVSASKQANTAAANLAAGLALDRLETNNLLRQFKAGIAGLSDTQQIANDQRIIAKAREIIREPRGKRTPKQQAADIKRAAQEGVQAQQEIKSIQDRQKAEAQSAAASAAAASAAASSAAEQAASDAQQRLRDADQAILDEQGLRDADASLASLKAQRTKSLVDDIAAEKAHIALLQAEIVQAGQIHDRLLRLQTLGSLNAELEQSKQAVKTLEAQQQQNRIDRAKLIRDRREQRLDLAVELAQANENVAAEKAAREAKIRFDKAQLATVHGDLVRAAQLRLDIAQETKAIRELKKQKDDQNAAARSLAFTYLQTQSGFAANLLSNLLPVGAARGTVGGAGGAPPALGPGAALTSNAALGAGGSGPTRSQAAVQINWLQAIHAALVGAKPPGTSHPEAASAAAWASTSMAHLGFW